MRRREFIKVVAGSAMTWPLAARAQQSAKETAIPIIGLLGLTSPEEFAEQVACQGAWPHRPDTFARAGRRSGGLTVDVVFWQSEHGIDAGECPLSGVKQT